MKVILLQDVARIGMRFDVKDVPDGHALNFLIPRGMAKPATKENIKQVAAQKGKMEEMRANADEVFKATCEKLKDARVEIVVPANEQGHLFKGLKAGDIAAAVTKQVGMLDPQQVVLATPIKTLGEHTVAISGGDVSGEFILFVRGE